jgi:hypothetical protein
VVSFVKLWGEMLTMIKINSIKAENNNNSETLKIQMSVFCADSGK